MKIHFKKGLSDQIEITITKEASESWDPIQLSLEHITHQANILKQSAQHKVTIGFIIDSPDKGKAVISLFSITAVEIRPLSIESDPDFDWWLSGPVTAAPTDHITISFIQYDDGELDKVNLNLIFIPPIRRALALADSKGSHQTPIIENNEKITLSASVMRSPLILEYYRKANSVIQQRVYGGIQIKKYNPKKLCSHSAIAYALACIVIFTKIIDPWAIKTKELYEVLKELSDFNKAKNSSSPEYMYLFIIIHYCYIILDSKVIACLFKPAEVGSKKIDHIFSKTAKSVLHPYPKMQPGSLQQNAQFYSINIKEILHVFIIFVNFIFSQETSQQLKTRLFKYSRTREPGIGIEALSKDIIDFLTKNETTINKFISECSPKPDQDSIFLPASVIENFSVKRDIFPDDSLYNTQAKSTGPDDVGFVKYFSDEKNESENSRLKHSKKRKADSSDGLDEQPTKKHQKESQSPQASDSDDSGSHANLSSSSGFASEQGQKSSSKNKIGFFSQTDTNTHEDEKMDLGQTTP